MLQKQKAQEFYAKWQGWILAGLAVVYLLMSALYPVFNHPRPWTFYFGIFIDDWIAFTPAWIVIYVVWYLYLPGIGLLTVFKDRQLYLRWILSFILGVGSCFLLYSIFQTTVPRPEVTGSDIFSRMVRMIYSNDLPYNCFPSIHVVTTYVCIIVLGKLKEYNRYLKLSLILLGWLINFSTLFVKQHVFADMVSGVLVACLAYWITGPLVNWLTAAKPALAVQESGEVG